MMNNDHYDANMHFLASLASPALIEQLRARDTAQREALARVEASAATLAIAGRGAWARASTAESQLAEAVKLIERLAKDGIKGERHQAVFDFLASHAQAEQQEAQGAQAGEFQREDRYIVIKRKDLDRLPMEMRLPFSMALNELAPRLPKRECLVIESDWPEYEPTWAAIQARVEGRAALATQPAADEPVAWMIDLPDEPELGHYFSESPDELTGSRSRPLFTSSPVETKKTLDEMRNTKEWLYGYRAALNLASLKFRRADGTQGEVSKRLLELRRETFAKPAVRGTEHDQ